MHGKKNLSNYKPMELLDLNLAKEIEGNEIEKIEIEKIEICDICDRKCKNERDLKIHKLLFHKGKKLIGCSFCDFFGPFMFGLHKMKDHIIKVHEKDQLLEFKPKELLERKLMYEIRDTQG